MCLISSSFTWLITKLVSDFAGVSICPRKKALHANENQIKLLSAIGLSRTEQSKPNLSILMLSNFKIIIHSYFDVKITTILLV